MFWRFKGEIPSQWEMIPCVKYQAVLEGYGVISKEKKVTKNREVREGD